MSSSTLLVDAVLATVTALFYAYVGAITLRRRVEDAEGRRAIRLFAAWWLGLAVLTLISVTRELLVLSGNLNVQLHYAMSAFSVLPLVLILWGLVYYLAYIYTGNARLFLPIALAHAAILAFLLYLVLTLKPTNVKVNDWSVALDYAVTAPKWMVSVLIAVILLPALAAAIGYGSLYGQTQDKSARYRIAMVSLAFIGWFGIAAIAAVTPLSKWYWWPLASRAVGLAATLMVLAAYRPPGWVRTRYDVRPVEDREEERRAPIWRSARTTLIRLDHPGKAQRRDLSRGRATISVAASATAPAASANPKLLVPGAAGAAAWAGWPGAPVTRA